MERKRFLVMGLGILGQSVAKSLALDGAEVIAVDRSDELVDQIKDKVAVAAAADVTDPRALEQLGVKQVDAAVVCIGEHFESAVLATAHLLDLGVKHVAVRANSELAASIMQRIGAHEVFYVEKWMGEVIGQKLRRPGLVNELDLGEGYRIIQWTAPHSMVGKTLAELSLPSKHKVQVIAIRGRGPNQEQHLRLPAALTAIAEGDVLFLAGKKEDLTHLFEAWDSPDR